MKTYHLSLTPDYCPDWTLVTALRELVANAIDTDEPWSITFDETTHSFTLESQGHIPLQALLMGYSDKPEDAIGRFGEGLKVAALVFARHGLSLTIDQDTTQWNFAIETHPEFHTPTLSVNVQTLANPIGNVVKTWVQELSETDYTDLFYAYQSMVATFEDAGCVYSCEDFSMYIRTNPDIFVKGLHVKRMDNWTFSYDFNPSAIQLNRDRNSLDAYAVSHTICQSLEDNPPTTAFLDKMYSLLKQDTGAQDWCYFINFPDSFPHLRREIFLRASQEAGGKRFADHRSTNTAGAFMLSSSVSSVIRGGYYGNKNSEMFVVSKQEPWHNDLTSLMEKNKSKIRRDVRVQVDALLEKYRAK